ncbi:hypothetical protein PASE110613_11855 [Paenibacillus sediminis]|uniref:Uncharacterized protein n=1 Tax=Paenibacillus sediminis TaxID=664909 RepID=A0ABS4H3F4_9BACL|nr:hypothetical protein [Paenibacillus sediminis]
MVKRHMDGALIRIVIVLIMTLDSWNGTLVWIANILLLCKDDRPLNGLCLMGEFFIYNHIMEGFECLG